MRRRHIFVRAAVFLRARGRCPTLRASLSVRPMRALLLLACLASAAAAAQSDPYRPLAVGNTWTFTRTAQSGSNAPQPLTSLRVRSVRDTVVSSRAAVVLECQRFSAEGTAGARGTAVAFRSPGASIRLTGNVTCERMYDGPTPSTFPGQVRVSNPLAVGGTAYPVASVAGSAYPVGPGGTHGSSDYRFDYADPIGQVRFELYSQSSSGGTTTTSSEVWTLAYAVVSGETYGANPVAGEPAPAAAATFRAYPNPARAALTVDADGAVRVFDALGRLVAQGDAAPTRPLRLDVSAWPAGVYVARTDAGQAVRLVVAR